MTGPEWAEFDLEITEQDGSHSTYRGWCRRVDVDNGPIAIESITLTDLHVGTHWSHSRGPLPVQPSNGPFA